MKDKSVSEERKLDMKKNGDKMEYNISQQRKKERKLIPLRIDQRTVVLVSKKKANKDYAQKKYNQLHEEVSFSRLKR